MKALVIFFALALSFSQAQASSLDLSKKKPEKKSVSELVSKEINRHFFNPTVAGKEVKGEATVMLEVMPEGNLKVVTVNTKNAIIQKFVEKQVKKMKIDSDELVVGQLFRYKLVFKAQ